MRKMVFLVLVVWALVLSGNAFAACTTALPTQAKQDFLSGVHDLADTYKIAFYTDTATFDATTTTYTATNEVSGTNYTAGGFTVADNGTTVPAPVAGNASTTGYIDFTDIAPTTITFTAASTCALLYNSTDSNKVIGVYSFSSIQPSAGTLTVDFPAAGAATSAFRFAVLDLLDWLIGPSEAVAADYVTRRDAYIKIPSLIAAGSLN